MPILTGWSQKKHKKRLLASSSLRQWFLNTAGSGTLFTSSEIHKLSDVLCEHSYCLASGIDATKMLNYSINHGIDHDRNSEQSQTCAALRGQRIKSLYLNNKLRRETHCPRADHADHDADGSWCDHHSGVVNGIYWLMPLIAKNRVLSALFLNQNNIGPQHGRFIGPALKQNVKLQTFCMNNNQLGEVRPDTVA